MCTDVPTVIDTTQHRLGLEEPKTDELARPCDTWSPAEGGSAAGGESEPCPWRGRLGGCQQALHSEGVFWWKAYLGVPGVR